MGAKAETQISRHHKKIVTKWQNQLSPNLLINQAPLASHREVTEETTLLLLSPKSNWLGRNPQPLKSIKSI